MAVYWAAQALVWALALAPLDGERPGRILKAGLAASLAATAAAHAARHGVLVLQPAAETIDAFCILTAMGLLACLARTRASA